MVTFKSHKLEFQFESGDRNKQVNIMEVIDGIKIFHDYPAFFKWINNFDGELRISVGGDVYFDNSIIARFNFIKK